MNVSTSVMGFNGIDLLMAVVIALAVYIRRGDGVVAELVKAFGIFCVVFITLHYYARFADFLRMQFFGKEIKTEFFAFCLLSVSIFLGFVFISSGWSLILRIKSFEIVDRWGNVILSLIRGYFICSMIYLALALSGNGYLILKAKQSAGRVLFSGAAGELYRATYSNFIEKFFPNEEINIEVFRLVEKIAGKTTSGH